MKLDDAGIVDTQSTPVLSGQQTQWEKRFDDKFVLLEQRIADNTAGSSYQPKKYSNTLNVFITSDEIKDFIRTLLSSSRTEVIKEMMGKMDGLKRRPKHAECVLGKCEMCDEDYGIQTINKTLNDVTTLLEKEGKRGVVTSIGTKYKVKGKETVEVFVDIDNQGEHVFNDYHLTKNL